MELDHSCLTSNSLPQVDGKVCKLPYVWYSLPTDYLTCRQPECCIVLHGQAIEVSNIMAEYCLLRLQGLVKKECGPS